MFRKRFAEKEQTEIVTRLLPGRPTYRGLILSLDRRETDRQISGFNSQPRQKRDRQTDFPISTLSSPPHSSTQRRIQGVKGSGDDDEHSVTSNAYKNGALPPRSVCLYVVLPNLVQRKPYLTDISCCGLGYSV